MEDCTRKTSGSRVKKIPGSGSASASKNISILTQKLFLSSRKYDPGCSSRIRIPDPDLYFLSIPDPGSKIPDPGFKKAPDPGPGSATLVLVLETLAKRLL
jgi:hypothetical protein